MKDATSIAFPSACRLAAPRARGAAGTRPEIPHLGDALAEIALGERRHVLARELIERQRESAGTMPLWSHGIDAALTRTGFSTSHPVSAAWTAAT